jgi:hypothetical protein
MHKSEEKAMRKTFVRAVGAALNNLPLKYRPGAWKDVANKVEKVLNRQCECQTWIAT